MTDNTTSYEAPQIVDYGPIADHTYVGELPGISGRGNVSDGRLKKDIRPI